MGAKVINERRENSAAREAYLVLVATAETTIDHHDVLAACAILERRPRRPLMVNNGPHA